mgnify:FL=1
MKLLTVQSSNIANVGYDQEELDLVVVFQNGQAYRYQDVPADIALGLLTAPSHGAYFANYIKNRYVYEKIDLAEENLHV